MVSLILGNFHQIVLRHFGFLQCNRGETSYSMIFFISYFCLNEVYSIIFLGALRWFLRISADGIPVVCER